MKYSFEISSWFKGDTRVQFYIPMLHWASLIYIFLEDWFSASFSNHYWKKHFRFCLMQTYLSFACNVFKKLFLWHGFISTWITPTAQMSRKRFYVRSSILWVQRNDKILRLQHYYLPNYWARKMFKPSEGLTSLLAELKKDTFVLDLWFSGGGRHKWGCCFHFVDLV